MASVLEFAEKVAGLKRLKRTGWVIKGVEAPESVADHSFMVAMLAYAYSKDMGLDAGKCARMALVHDICEAYSGDIPSRVRKEDRTMPASRKRKLEKEGLVKITSLLGGGAAAEIRGLWGEFGAGKSAEARLVRDLDKLEMCMQALEYAKKVKRPNERAKFAEFFTDGELNIKTPAIRKAFRTVRDGFLRRK